MINSLNDAIRELYFFTKTGTAGSFQTGLFHLFHLADSENKAKLALAFPLQFTALEMWHNMGDDLFRELGLM